ncbi:histone-lysine N-methyltransferase SETMAR-like [Choristoneura fumiferana]|uniref:histone-lysine N-methyltransferase SETMAR-like n=1 Tax=Choristoneura fumiferana TaxID=7141 RepID=UPI003D157A58
MKIMKDEYGHVNCTVMYVEENIPGTIEDTDEYTNLITNFNSQLTDHCNCDTNCVKNTCKCLSRSGGANYEFRDEDQSPHILLNFKKYTGSSISFPLMECNSLCKCSEYCGNRVVQKGPIKCLVVKPCTVSSKGMGLFTSKAIPKGTFICEYAGEVITPQQAAMRNQMNFEQGRMNYIFCLNEFSNSTLTQTIVDPSNFGNIGRYINHSCEPNCFIVPVRVESPLPKLAIFSNVDIPSNSEITFNYGSHIMNLSKSIKNRKKCLCEKKNCIGYMPNEAY